MPINSLLSLWSCIVYELCGKAETYTFNMLSPSSIFQIFGNTLPKEFEPYLPESMSFLEVDNKNVLVSALKKSEKGDSLIIRVYNLATSSQKVKLQFFQSFTFKDAKFVNLLEETPKSLIKARITETNKNSIKLEIEPHVVVTIKIEL